MTMDSVALSSATHTGHDFDCCVHPAPGSGTVLTCHSQQLTFSHHMFEVWNSDEVCNNSHELSQNTSDSLSFFIFSWLTLFTVRPFQILLLVWLGIFPWLVCGGRYVATMQATKYLEAGRSFSISMCTQQIYLQNRVNRMHKTCWSLTYLSGFACYSSNSDDYNQFTILTLSIILCAYSMHRNKVNLFGLRTTNLNTSWKGLTVSLISVTDLCKQQCDHHPHWLLCNITLKIPFRSAVNCILTHTDFHHSVDSHSQNISELHGNACRC